METKIERGHQHVQAKEPEAGTPDSHPRSLSTYHTTLCRESLELGISAPEIISGTFARAPVSPCLGLSWGEGSVSGQWNSPEVA